MWMFANLIFLTFLGGVVAVASNPAPYFAALGLVVVAVGGSLMVAGFGGTFLPLAIVLIYVGGMLVVFAYACAFSSEAHPEAWGSEGSMELMWFLTSLAMGAAYYMLGPGFKFHGGGADMGGGHSVLRGDLGGVGALYEGGCLMLVVAVWALLLALLAVMEIVRGGARGTLRI